MRTHLTAALVAAVLLVPVGTVAREEPLGLITETIPDDQHGVSKPRAPYSDRTVDMTLLAAIGAALAEMRREYSA